MRHQFFTIPTLDPNPGQDDLNRFCAAHRVVSLEKQFVADGEGVPAYALFTNEQLAEMVRRRIDSPTTLNEIEGVGASRIEKYGARFVDALRAALGGDSRERNDAPGAD